jgi:hypothetical protein
MAELDLRVDDLVLFYMGDTGVPKTCALTNELLNDPAVSVGVQDLWQSAVLLDRKLDDGSGNYYVANLSLLLPPNQPGTALPSRDVDPAPPAPGLVRTAGDLVVIPFSPKDPTKAAVIPRSYYSQLPEIDHDMIPDLVYMATDEGVTVANLPKFDLPGISCGLLNLTSLRSGSSKPAVVDADSTLESAVTGPNQAMLSKTRRAIAYGDAQWKQQRQSIVTTRSAT